MIPFVDEAKMLKAEDEFKKTGQIGLNKREKIRNTSSFDYYSYTYRPPQSGEGGRNPLVSTLTQMDDLPVDNSHADMVSEYANVGEKSFQPIIAKGLTHP